MSYLSMGQPGQYPGFPGGLPGPISRAAGPVGPNMPTHIFPTHTRVGDVVTITGPFGGMTQGSVRVKFQGSSWLSPQMMGPGTASVVVPEGAENGVCEVEINGRRVFGINCIVDSGTDRVGRPSHKGRDARAWTQRGELQLSGSDPLTVRRLASYALYVYGAFQLLAGGTAYYQRHFKQRLRLMKKHKVQLVGHAAIGAGSIALARHLGK